MNRAIRTVLLIIFILLPACTDLGELGEEMSDARDAARPTIATENQIPTEVSADSAEFVIEFAKPELAQAISGYPQISRAVQVLQSAEFNQLLQPNLEYTIFVPTDAAFAANSDLAAALNDGRTGLFRIELFDCCDEDGDIVELDVNGALFATVPIMHQGTKLSIPLQRGNNTISIRGVKDGGGGVTLSFRTSRGDYFARYMAVGEEYQMNVVVR